MRSLVKRASRQPLESRECYRGIEAYSPGRTEFRVDLSDNTNLWGAPPAAVRILGSRGSEDISRYPQAYSVDLGEKLAEYAGVTPDMIVAGCGSDDVIDSAIRAFADPGDVLCLAEPTFSMLPIFAKMSGLRTAPARFDAKFELDPETILATGARITYLCSPNNPTGTTLPRAFVEAIVEGTTGLVIIDEAYIEFGGESAVELAAGGRVLITRTMSKAFGLAGLRIGYGIGAPGIVSAVAKARGPYKVNAVAEAAAVAVLAEDRGWIAERISETKKNRARFTRAVESLGYQPVPSWGNFVLVPVRSCAETAARLRGAGIGVRPLRALAGIGDALRIAIGPWEMMEQCLDALRECP